MNCRGMVRKQSSCDLADYIPVLYLSKSFLIDCPVTEIHIMTIICIFLGVILVFKIKQNIYLNSSSTCFVHIKNTHQVKIILRDFNHCVKQSTLT